MDSYMYLLLASNSRPRPDTVCPNQRSQLFLCARWSELSDSVHHVVSICLTATHQLFYHLSFVLCQFPFLISQIYYKWIKLERSLLKKILKLRYCKTSDYRYPETKNVVKNASLYEVVLNAKLTKNYSTNFVKNLHNTTCIPYQNRFTKRYFF